ncbi:MAG: hypothetical protein JW885_02805 [Deltaproteobacteria bacterium]|nr:hypothetical protein [Candidatus Zymogenaceae bacterium]
MLYANEDIKSGTYIARPGAAEGDRICFVTAPLWEDRHLHVLRIGSKFETVGGGVHRQSYSRSAIGLPITLAGNETDGLIWATGVEALRELFSEGIVMEFSEDDGATTYSVEADYSVDPLDMRYTDTYKKRMCYGTIHMVRV